MQVKLKKQSAINHTDHTITNATYWLLYLANPNPDLQSPMSHGHDPYACKNQGHRSVGPKDKSGNRRMVMNRCSAFHTNSTMYGSYFQQTVN